MFSTAVAWKLASWQPSKTDINASCKSGYFGPAKPLLAAHESVLSCRYVCAGRLLLGPLVLKVLKKATKAPSECALLAAGTRR